MRDVESYGDVASPAVCASFVMSQVGRVLDCSTLRGVFLTRVKGDLKTLWLSADVASGLAVVVVFGRRSEDFC